MLYICSWYAYDSWNRVQTMTYPDGEVVTYHYNAGQVESLTSNKQGRQSVIVDRIGYDKEGHMVYTKLGNGAETTYIYDKQRERLQVMNLTADGQTVMENRYRYDAVDNILGITDAANPTSLTKLNKAKLGGKSMHTYEYDELNRLVHANGKAKHTSYDMVIWIQTPRPNTTPNTNPGPPVSWNDPSNPDDPQAGYGYIPNDTTKEETFFYHSDHLGSTSYITDDRANITQYDAYLPYGELLVDEHSSSKDMPYKFNGKELDEETGLYYYGARYMDPKISMWLGVDPLREKYPSVTGYCYTMDNPIGLMDPTGMAPKYPTIKETIVYGMKHSRTFKKLLSLAGITLKNYDQNISFGRYTATDGETGKITLTKGTNKKYQIVKLAHELSNRINVKAFKSYRRQVEMGKITAAKYANLVAGVEVDGEINQIKVAADLHFHYPEKRYENVNSLIDKYIGDRKTKLKDYIIPSTQHIKEYTSIGRGYRSAYLIKNKKKRQ